MDWQHFKRSNTPGSDLWFEWIIGTWLIGCFVTLWFGGCTTQRTIASGKVFDTSNLYTVTVYIKNEAPFYGSGGSGFHIEYPYSMEMVKEDAASPVIKYVYSNVTEAVYKELYRKLKDRPEVLTIEKSR